MGVTMSLEKKYFICAQNRSFTFAITDSRLVFNFDNKQTSSEADLENRK